MLRLRRSALLNDALVLWLGQMGGIVISVAAGIVLTRVLGPEGRGIYAWLLATVALGSMFAMCGFDGINRRYGGAHPTAMRRLIHLNLLVVGGVGLVLALGLGLWASHTPAAGPDAWAIGLAMLALVPMAWQTALGPLLLSCQNVRAAALFNFLPKLGQAVGIVTLVLLGWVSVRNALWVNLAVAMGGLALLAYWLGPAYRKPSPMGLRALAGRIGWGGGSLFVAGIGQFYLQKMDVVMMGLLLSNAEVGFYAVASNLADILVTPASAVAGILAARVAANAQGHALGKILLAVGLFTAAMAGAFCLVSPWLVPFLYGPHFAPAVPAVQALSPAIVALALFYVLQACLAVTGHARVLALPPLLGLGLNIPLNLWLMPAAGILGACWASAISYTAAALLAGWLMMTPRQAAG